MLLLNTMGKEVRKWKEQAEADLKTAKDNISMKNYYASVFFSQQAAEKGLKALYIKLENKEPPKIHDLVKLSLLTGAPESVKDASVKLSPVYILSRYLGPITTVPFRYYRLKKAKSHLAQAEVILAWIRKKLKI